jgi:hypothetical protein
MKRILFHSLAAAAVCAMAMGSADAASRKHHAKGHYYGKTWRNGAHNRYSAGEPRRPFVRLAVDGAAIDRDVLSRLCQYLSSVSACTGEGP